MTDIEKIIAEYAENMPHGEFTHDSECIEHEEWFKRNVREIVNLALQEYESLPKTHGVIASCGTLYIPDYNIPETGRVLKEAGFQPGDKFEFLIRKIEL